jgi:hypothetical protein
MSEKLRAILDRAVEQANQRMTAIQKGEFHPRIDVVHQSARADSMMGKARSAV